MSARIVAAESSTACRAFSISCLPAARFFSASFTASRKLVDLLHAFQDFIGEHAAGHFGRGDLLEQRLVFAVAVGRVELHAQVDDLLLARLEIELLAVDRHLRLLGLVAGFGELGFELGDVRFAGADLLGAALEAVAQSASC